MAGDGSRRRRMRWTVAVLSTAALMIVSLGAFVLAETVTTADGKPSAHFERSVAVTRNGPWVLGGGYPPGVVNVDLSDRSAAVPVGASLGRKERS